MFAREIYGFDICVYLDGINLAKYASLQVTDAFLRYANDKCQVINYGCCLLMKRVARYLS